MALLQIRNLSSATRLIFAVSLFCCATISVVAQDGMGPEGEAIALFNQGQDAHEKGELKAAIDLYEKALKLLPDFPEAELQRGSAYQSLGDLSTAEAAFRKAVALREDWSLALANLGSLLVRKGKYDEARPILKRAIEVDADNTPAYVATTTLAISTNAPDTELKELYKKIASIAAAAKTIPSIWTSKAILENALNEKKAAELSAKKALELDPKSVSMLALLGSLAVDSGDPSFAANQVAKIETINPAAEGLTYLKVRLLLAEGKSDEALKLIEAS